MKIHRSPLAGACVIELERIEDERGFFSERYSYRKFAARGFDDIFVQDNHSRSHPRVLRGLHYQFAPAQTKLVSVTLGRIWDVIVDIRRGSPTCGRWFATELSAENGRCMWVPAGFAHGFVVLGDQPADVHYKASAHYRPGGEGGIAHDDEQLDIPWPCETVMLSPRDRNLPKFAEYMANPKFNAVNAFAEKYRSTTNSSFR